MTVIPLYSFCFSCSLRSLYVFVLFQFPSWWSPQHRITPIASFWLVVVDVDVVLPAHQLKKIFRLAVFCRIFQMTKIIMEGTRRLWSDLFFPPSSINMPFSCVSLHMAYGIYIYKGGGIEGYIIGLLSPKVHVLILPRSVYLPGNCCSFLSFLFSL